MSLTGKYETSVRSSLDRSSGKPEEEDEVRVAEEDVCPDLIDLTTRKSSSFNLVRLRIFFHRAAAELTRMVAIAL